MTAIKIYGCSDDLKEKNNIDHSTEKGGKKE